MRTPYESRMRHVLLSAGLSALLAVHAQAQSLDVACGGLANRYGPYDYRVERDAKLKIVEDYHFGPQVESLISGQSSTIGGDLDYTLRAFPNHHRALISMMNLGARLKTPMPPGAQFSVECYFKRALFFRPDDTIARMIYAKYLASDRRRHEAIGELEVVARAAPDNGFTQYNVGLLYFELGEFDKALQQAHRASSLGFEAMGLRQQLQASNRWQEPAAGNVAPMPSTPTAGSQSAASAASESMR